MNSSPKNENSVIIYSRLHRSNLYDFFSFVEYKDIFIQWESIVDKIVWLPTFFKMSSFCFVEESDTHLHFISKL